MNNSPPSPQKKVFDVTRPGKTPATPGSRPVIQSRKSVEDPDVSNTRPLMNPKQKVRIKPTEGKNEKMPAQQADATIQPPVPESEEPASKPEPEELPPTEAPHKPETPAPEEPAPKPNPAEDPPKPEPPEAPTLDESALPEPNNMPAPEPLHEPLHMGMPGELSHGKAIVSHHRPRRRTLWLEILGVFLIIALLAAIANLLLDAGVIKTGLSVPHTDFFEQR